MNTARTSIRVVLCATMAVLVILLLTSFASAQSRVKKVLLVVTSHDKLGNTGKPTGFWLPEMTHPYFALTARKIQVDIASPKGGKAPIDPRSIDLHDPDNKRFMDDKALVAKIDGSLAISKVNPSDYDAILFAGGHGPMWDFVDDAALLKAAMAIYNRGGIVGAVCHGPAALVNLKSKDGKYLVAGKKVTAFTNDEEEKAGYTKVVPFLLESKLKERGAIFVAAPTHSQNVIVSGKLVTGQNPASARKLGEEMAKLVEAIPLD